jgi:hypothetical protein
MKRLRFGFTVFALAALAFGATLFLTSPGEAARLGDVLTRPVLFEPNAGDRQQLRALAGSPSAPTIPAPEPLVDQHFRGCDDARAAGRMNIPSWDPSYRAEMDGDGDGLACEPYYGARRSRH